MPFFFLSFLFETSFETWKYCNMEKKKCKRIKREKTDEAKKIEIFWKKVLTSALGSGILIKRSGDGTVKDAQNESIVYLVN